MLANITVRKQDNEAPVQICPKRETHQKWNERRDDDRIYLEALDQERGEDKEGDQCDD